MADLLFDFLDFLTLFFEEYLPIVVIAFLALVGIVLSLAMRRRRTQLSKARAIATVSGSLFQLVFGEKNTPKNLEGLLAFLKLLQGHLSPYRFSIEYKITKISLESFIWVPDPLQATVLQLVAEHVPDLLIKKIEEEVVYPSAYSDDITLLSVLPQNPFEPILDSVSVEGDFYQKISSIASSLDTEQTIIVQIQCAAPKKQLLKRFSNFIYPLESGEPNPKIKEGSNFFIEVFKEFFKIFTTLPGQMINTTSEGSSSAGVEQKKELTEEEQEHVTRLKEKQSEPLFACTINICADKLKADMIPAMQKVFSDTFGLFTKGTKNIFTFSPIIKPADIYTPLSKRRPWSSSPLLLTPSELVSFIKFPDSVEDPKLQIAGKALLQSVPSSLHYTEYDPALIKIGQVEKQGQQLTVGLSLEDFRHNYFIAGRPKQGKTTFASRLVLQQFHQRGKSVIFDTYGQMTKILLEQLFQQKKKVIVLDFHDDLVFSSCVAHPFITTNTLRKTVIDIFSELFRDQMSNGTGPVFDYIVERVLATVCARGGILYDIPYLLLDEGFRQRYLQGIVDPHLKTFWNQEYPKVAKQVSVPQHPLCSIRGPMYSSKAIQALFGRRVPQQTMETLLTNYDVIIFQTSALSILERKVITNGLLLELASMLEQRKVGTHTMVAIEDAQIVLCEKTTPLFSPDRDPLLTGVFCSETISNLPKTLFDLLRQKPSHRIFFNLINEEHEAMSAFDPIFEKSVITLLEPYHAYTELVIQKKESRLFLMNTLPLEQADLLQDYFRNFFKQQ